MATFASPRGTAAPIRVLVVDDSVVVRRALSNILDAAGGIEVVGTASSARNALEKLPLTEPDLVLLDIDMPDMEGTEAIPLIHALMPGLPVVMCSTLSEAGASATLKALARGASDYVPKPSSLAGTGLTGFNDELVAKVRALGRRGRARRGAPAPTPRSEVRTASTATLAAMRPAPAPTTRARPPATVVAIGASTGGPNALATLLAELPADFPVPLVVVQHMPALFTKMLAERLDANARIGVHEATAGMVLLPGHAYVAPGDFHLTLERDAVGREVRACLDRSAPVGACRPAVDVLFRSVAHVFGPRALGVVLTGMGRDGAEGARALADRGGAVVVQEPSSCVVPTMPEAVLGLGVADGALPIERLGAELISRVRHGL